MNNIELVQEVLKMAGADTPVEKQAGGITCHSGRYGYVLGGQGELYTQDLAKKWAAARRSGKPPEYFLSSAKAWYTPPRRIVDCSGMIVEAIRTRNPKYADRTANSFKAQFVKSGGITNIPNISGLAVWKSGHIGVYLGNGKVCESRGVSYGVVISELQTQKWTHFGYIKDIDYASATAPAVIQLSRVLKLGMSGADVKAVKDKLLQLGFLQKSTHSTFGADTLAAVKAFQQANKLVCDGIVGKQTIEAFGGVWRN